MIYHYQVSMRGFYHIKANTVCQDYAYYQKINDDIAIAAVADGLGSEKHSDIASKLASEEAVNYCAKHYLEQKDDNSIFQMLKESFNQAYNKIDSYIKEHNDDISEYDTTLVVAIYDKGTLYYGSIGDSGIIVLRSNGLYEIVTEKQNDEYGCVYPLYDKEKWRFKKEENVASILLATDGMLNAFTPVYLNYNDIKIHVPLAEFFMNPKILKFEENSEEKIQKEKEDFIAKISPKSINDDKTILLIANPNIEIKQQDEHYYEEPDWAKLKEKFEEHKKEILYELMQGYKEKDDKEDEN